VQLRMTATSCRSRSSRNSSLASEVLLDSTGEQSLVLYTAQPGTDTTDKLELLRVLGQQKFAELPDVR
jgi:hypothetical protein